MGDLSSNVVGVEAARKVTSEDYEHLLVPGAEAARAASPHGKVRLWASDVDEARERVTSAG